MFIFGLGFSDRRLPDTSVSSKLKIYRVFDRMSQSAFYTQSAICSLHFILTGYLSAEIE